MFDIAEPVEKDKQSIFRRVIKLSSKPCIPVSPTALTPLKPGNPQNITSENKTQLSFKVEQSRIETMLKI